MHADSWSTVVVLALSLEDQMIESRFGLFYTCRRPSINLMLE